MMYSGQTHYAVEKFGYYEGVKKLTEGGFQGLDWVICAKHDYLFEPDWKETAKKLRQTAEEAGSQFVQAHAPFTPEHPDIYIRDFVPHMPRSIEFAGLLGAKYIVVHPIRVWPYFTHEKEGFEKNLEFFGSLAQVAKDNGVKVAIENIFQNRPVTKYLCDDFASDPYEQIALYEALNDPEAFTICFDIGHSAVCGREPQDAIRLIGHDRLGCIHAHDNDYRADLHQCPGAGKINWEAVCKALAEIDYEGSFNLECPGFYRNFGIEFWPEANRFFANTAKFLANKVETYKAEMKAK